MWILRFLNGPMAGQTIPLNKHSTLLGRAPNCDVKIANANISKEHTRIEVFDDKLIVTDAGSRNGTFINGVQVRSSKARVGDKISMHDVMLEVQQVPDGWANQFNQGSPYRSGGPPVSHGNLAYESRRHSELHTPAPAGSALEDLLQGRFPYWANLLQEYIDRVVLPGVYRLPEMFDFKWVLAGMMAGFIMLVTTLSTIPLIHILRSSLEEESQQHAMTIATTLARVNIPALAQGLDTAVSVEIATSRPGVKQAFVISNVDGNIIAPANMAGSFPEVTYVHEGRKLDKESVHQIDSNTVIAMYPVRAYNSDTGAQAVTAWAVVLYDMTALAVDNTQVLRLFINTLFISLLLGFVLFYFLYKVIEHPIRSMNTQLDIALKEGHETVEVNYRFPAMQTLASNVSSALARALNGSQESVGQRAAEHDRNREIANLVELMGFAAMGMRAEDLTIAAVNQAFESRIGASSAQLSTLTLNELSDQALKLSVKDLIERLDKDPDNLASNDLEFSGLNFQVVGQAIYGTSKIAYYLIVLLPKSEGGQ